MLGGSLGGLYGLALAAIGEHRIICAILIVGIITADFGALRRRHEVRFGSLIDLADSASGIELLAAGRGQLSLAVALSIAGSTSRGSNVSSSAECIIEGRGRRATLGDIGDLAKAHQLDGDVFVFFRHAATDGRVRGRENTHSAAIAGIADAIAVSTVRPWCRVHVGV